jgi:hypothetical protein
MFANWNLPSQFSFSFKKLCAAIGAAIYNLVGYVIRYLFNDKYPYRTLDTAAA